VQGRTELIFQAGNFFLPGQKLIGDQRFGHECAIKKCNNNDKKPLLFKKYFQNFM